MNPIEDKLSDLEMSRPRSLMSRKWKIISLLLIAAFAISSILFTHYAYKARFKDDKGMATLQMDLGAVAIYLFVAPALAMLLTLPVSLLPLKGYSYKSKYWVFTLVTMLIFQLFFCTISIYSYYNPKQKTEHFQKE